LSVTRKEHKIIERWVEKVRKTGCAIDAKWTMDELTREGEAQNRLNELREFLVTAARGGSGDLSHEAVAYGTWRLLSVNESAARLAKSWFRVNEQYEAVGRADGSEQLEAGGWLDAVFQEITGVDYSRYGRTKQLASFGLCEDWRFGMARHLVEQWIDCIRYDPMGRTWHEARRDVNDLVEKTTFKEVLEKKVEVRAQEFFRRYSGRPDAQEYWGKIQELVIDYLEGPDGVYSEWMEFTAAPRDYGGRYRLQFRKVPWSKQLDWKAVEEQERLAAMTKQQAARGYPQQRRTALGRVNEMQDYALHELRAPIEQVNAANEVVYASLEEAQQVAMEPCEWHIKQMVDRGKLSESEARAKMHPTCACLNTRNPYLRSTLLEGGLEAILRRERMPPGDDKERVWREQMAEVRDKLRRMRGAGRVAICSEEEMIFEAGDGVVQYNIEGAVHSLQTAGPPGF
jgi:hypothetical protein